MTFGAVTVTVLLTQHPANSQVSDSYPPSLVTQVHAKSPQCWCQQVTEQVDGVMEAFVGWGSVHCHLRGQIPDELPEKQAL